MADYILLAGISEYADRYMSNLRLAHRDAQNLHGFFRHGLGFGDNAILLPHDVSLRDFNRQFNAIGQKIKSGDRLIVYFSGHGYQHGDEQFLLLADAEKAEIEAGRLAMQEVISLKTLKARVESWPNIECLFILDTCRRPLSAAQHRGADIPYEGNALLSRMFARDPACGAALDVSDSKQQPSRTLVLNACSDGDYAWEPEDGDASVLVKAFENAWGEALKRGEAIRIDHNAPAKLRDQIRRLWGKEHPQTPWLSPADGVFELRSANQPKTATPEKESQRPQPEDDDETEWAIAVAENSIEAFKVYARRKPPGKYRDEALRRIGELASNDASQEQQAKTKRDEARHKNAVAGKNLTVWQKTLKEAETEELRSEARGEIVKFEQEAAKARDDERCRKAEWGATLAECRSLRNEAETDAGRERLSKRIQILEQDIQGRVQRDKDRRTEAKREGTQSAWQKAAREAETDEFREEAQRELSRFDKKPSKLGWIIGAVMIGLGIFVFSGEDPVPAPSPARVAEAEKPEPVKPESNVVKPPVQAPATRSTPTSNGPDIAMVRIPAGSFTMGSPSGEIERSSSEGPQRTVSIRAFEMGKYEVTQGQWKAVMGSNPSHFSQCGDDCPVEKVSWNMVQDFLKQLNAQTGSNYRLPSEAEWEYAARAGTTGPFSFTGPITAEKANYDANDQYDGSPKGSYRGKTVKVGSLPANPWGLHEVHGNAWEWVQDCWHGNYEGAPVDERAWETACEYDRRVLRGGSWDIGPRVLRSAYRDRSTPDDRYVIIGFRLARTLP